MEEKLKNLISYLNGDLGANEYPLIKMVISHYQFEAIHPFNDGNGRSGRILNLLYLTKTRLLSYPVLYISLNSFVTFGFQIASGKQDGAEADSC